MINKLELLSLIDLNDTLAYEHALEILFSIPELPVYSVKFDLSKGDLIYRSRQNDGRQNFNLSNFPFGETGRLSRL